MLGNTSVVLLVNDLILFPLGTGVPSNFPKPVIHLVFRIDERRLVQSCELPSREYVSAQERVGCSRRQQHEASARDLVVSICPWRKDNRHGNEHGNHGGDALCRTLLQRDHTTLRCRTHPDKEA